jgi:hypothetical protein
METKEQLKQDKSKLIDEILELVHVIEKKDEHIEHLKKKLEFKEVKFKDEDIDELFDRNI